MNVLVVLPHRDVTLRPRAPEGFVLHDASAAFWSRVAGAGGLGATLERWRAMPWEAARARTLLTGSVAEALLTRGPDLHERLWATGAALEAIGSEYPHLRLRLDDLELVDGSTERPVDVAAAAERVGPWEAELEAALAVAEGAERVALWLDRDQQLPCAEAFARRLPQPERLELWGPFAVEHADALRKLPALGRARVIQTELPVEVIAPPGHADVGALAWREEGAPVPLTLWAGRVRLEELSGIAEAGSARAVCFAFCAVTTEAVLGVDGVKHPRAAVELAMAKLVNAGVRVLCEWWVGAPGVSERAHLESAEELSQAQWPLAGLRAFHWTRGRPAASFDGTPVALLPVDADRTLFRTHPFEAEGTVGREHLHQVLQACLATLGKLPSRVPGGSPRPMRPHRGAAKTRGCTSRRERRWCRSPSSWMASQGRPTTQRRSSPGRCWRWTRGLLPR